MAGSLGDFADRLITQLGGKPTPQSRKLFSAWQRWEGGHTANAATWNPLNLTAPGSGLPTINSVGVVALPSKQAGVQRTAKLLQSGYPALAQAMKTGMVDFTDPLVQGDLNRWLTGKRTPGQTPYVSKIAKAYGAALPPAAAQALGVKPGKGTPVTPAAPRVPEFDPMAYAESVRQQYLEGGGRMDLTRLPGLVGSSFRTPPPPPVVPGATPSPPAPGTAGETPGLPISYRGKTMVLPTAWKSTHPTSGLEKEGFTHAQDIMGRSGTPVGSPVDGTIIRRGSAQGGQSIYLQGNDGRTYWIGHIESNLPAGTKVKRGQVIAAISADHPNPHVHLDWSTSYR